jgi:ATP-dependent DNA helicase RecG
MEAPSIRFVKGVGPKVAERLAARGISTVREALFFFPRGYEDRRRFVPLHAVRAGASVCVKGRVIDVRGGKGGFGRNRVLDVTIADGTGRLSLKWFRYNPALADRFAIGAEITLCGSARTFGPRLEMHHPEILGGEVQADPFGFGRIVPVYPEIEGVPARTLRKVMWEVVHGHADEIREFLPRWILEAAGVPSIRESVAALHFPPDDADVAALQAFASPAQHRLVFGELFFIQWTMALRRCGVAREESVPLPWDREIVDEIKRRLPFALTNAQRRVLNEVLKDMSKLHPMHRLMQGDVGSGKTIVAWVAAMIAWKNGAQSALMAPTEILAEQHYRRFADLCFGLNANVVLLTASVTGKAREAARAAIREGRADIVVGTHAIIQEGVEFRNLSLAIIDEQHRFGVLQRAALRGKGAKAPHMLVMTATPIPRTLAMTLYGDLDVSIIDEMPPGRSPVKTRVLSEAERRVAWEATRTELAAGGRAYVVLPLVEESEKLALRDAVKTAEAVRAAFPGVGVGLLHGRMKAEEKDAVMRRFKQGDDRILVSTTVIEVGVDVPEATLMIVEHADRFGLSQLHQLRGRVGRGTRPSSCFLMASPGGGGEETRARLSVMERTNDGFKIAEEDLKIRGPGDFSGVRQSGIPDLVFSDLVRDAPFLFKSREIAERLLAADPRLEDPAHAPLKAWIEERRAAAQID